MGALGNLKKIRFDDFGTLIGLFGLGLIISLLSPVFLSVDNLMNVLMQSCVNGFCAIGVTFIIITAGIDLSIGSILALSGVVLASALEAGWPVAVCILIGLLVGALCGFINGFFITIAKLPPFIATLGMMSIARGVALVYTNGVAISGLPKSFRWFGNGEIPIIGLPSQILIIIILSIGAWYLLKYTSFGRYIYAIGGNEETARLSGINTRKYKTIVYTLAGLFYGIGAIVLSARLNSAQPIAGYGFELDAIAAVVIGGTSLEGGYGRITGTLIGVVIIGVLRNGLNLLDVSSYVQQLIIGLVIIAAVLIDRFRK